MKTSLFERYRDDTNNALFEYKLALTNLANMVDSSPVDPQQYATQLHKLRESTRLLQAYATNFIAEFDISIEYTLELEEDEDND